MSRAAIKAMASRVAKLTATVRPHRLIVAVSASGSGVYWFNGAAWSRAAIDELLLAGHSIVVREIPAGYMDL